MRKRAVFIGLAGAALLSAVSGQASAKLEERKVVVQQGDFLLIGNTLAHNCATMGVPKPIVGTTNCPMTGISDNSPDVLWQSENGTATADPMITPDQAQSVAVLTIPEGATVTHAFVYWSARSFLGNDSDATLECLGAPQPLMMTADTNQVGDNAYQASDDVTAYVKQHGSCAYRVGGVSSHDFKGLNETIGHSAWFMVVFYSHPNEPHRQLALYDGFELVSDGDVEEPSTITGMLVPNNFTKFSKAKLGVVGYEGDGAPATGDQLLLLTPQSPNGIPLQDSSKMPNDFFNSTRSFFEMPVSVMGDLPQLTGAAGSMSHIDMDVVDISQHITPGTTEINFKPVSVEPIYLAALISSLPTFTDEDKDGISDDEEVSEGLDPKDADTDNDGVLDGQEGCSDLANCPDPIWNVDSDGDGLINALDPDSDDDGLYDGTETGQPCMNPPTQTEFGHCIADADDGKTKTDPLNADTDGGGVIDGAEDWNLNGQIDGEETDPTAGNGADDSKNVDSDGDGLSDGVEDHIGSDKNDGDSDDDGVLDGAEANYADDTDGDGLPNVLDVDSDDDALFDGTELGSQCDDPSTDILKNHCRVDADPNTGTSMVDADTDNGGVIDGSEDSNLNGKVDSGELDPTAGHGTDDGTVKDSDGDGLSDDLEDELGSDKNDTDSDDDGVPDGEEANPSNDEDGDGNINVLDEDSDADGLFDGTEGGYGCSGPDTDKGENNCIPDGDQGKTHTSMVDPDTDNGGLLDGAEDFDKDGKYEPTQGEGNPLDPSDDGMIIICDEDRDCGPENSGKVCDTNATPKICVDGCKDVDGSRCPNEQMCIIDPGEDIGYCSDGSGGAGGGNGFDIAVQGGCLCDMRPGDGKVQMAWALMCVLGAGLALRRRGRNAG